MSSLLPFLFVYQNGAGSVETKDVIIPLVKSVIDPNLSTRNFTTFDGILWLVAALAMYLIFDRRNSEKQITVVDQKLNEIQNILTSTPTPPPPVIGKEEVFQAAINLLKDPNRNWRSIYIYAPVGLWETLEKKKEWFRSLREDLLSEKSSLSELRGVYGLPPVDEYLKESRKNVEKMVEILACSGSALYCIPPAFEGLTTAPGLGMVIFDNKVLVLCFARDRNSTVVDTGIVINDDTAASLTREWFENQVWRIFAGRKEFGIFDASRDRNIALEQGLKNINGIYDKMKGCQPLRNQSSLDQSLDQGKVPLGPI